MNEAFNIDQRAHGMQQVGDVIQAVAVHHSQVDIDETTHERWRQLMGLMRELDTATDSTQLNTNQAMRALTSSNSPWVNRYPALFPDEIELESYQALLVRARSIIELGAMATSTRNLSHFIACRTLEARQAASLLHDSATTYVRGQSAFTDSFMPLAQSCAISANFYDSFVDAKRDYARGQMKLMPDVSFYRQVGVLSIQHFLPVSKAIFHGPVIKAFGPMAIHGITNKLRYDSDGNVRSWTARKRQTILV